MTESIYLYWLMLVVTVKRLPIRPVSLFIFSGPLRIFRFISK